MKKKLEQYEIYKIPTTKLVEHKGKRIKVIPLTLTKREALENGEMVKIQSNQLTNKLLDYFVQHNIPFFGLDMSEIIVNIVVPTESKKTGEKEYEAIAKQGFILNGKRYVRLYSGSGQIRRNTVTFIREDLYEPVFNSLLCGLELKDFGNDFNAAKFNAYCGLNMSGCQLLPEQLSPNVCIVDDFEQIRPHNTVNYVTEKEVEYIALPDEDFILTDTQTEFDIVDGKAIRKTDGVEFTIYKGVKKHIEAKPYDEIEDSPALNSFDGQGLMSPGWAKRISSYLDLGYVPSEIIVRAPWVKGLLVNIPFKEWFEQHGITQITDSFGKIRKIAGLDCIISKSQFKMHKVYKAKCEPMGINPWDYHQEAMKENNLLWGITRTNGRNDDYNKALNYQYIQAFQLENDDVDKLCETTEDFLRRLNSGNIDEVYNSLIVNNKGFSDSEIDEDVADSGDYKKLFQKVIEANPAFIDDKHIRSLIFKECETKLNGAKLGKILVRGNFQFCVSDPIAQLEWIANNHCGYGIEIKGVVPAGHIYSNYWFGANDFCEEIVLMRSPLIDRNEIAKRKVVTSVEHYFRYLNSGIVYSIHDLTALQQGGCDFDGDIIFSTNNQIIAKGCFSYEVAKPLYYSLTTTDLVGKLTQSNIIEADIRGLNSAVGTISNKGGSLYAMLEEYNVNCTEYRKIYDSIVALGQVVGMEIDRIKTAVAPTFPLEWKSLQYNRMQKDDFIGVQINSEPERQGIYRHNELVPDVKPYYFRYNYCYLDDSIKTLQRAFNEVSVPTFGKKFSDVITLCKSGDATDEMKQLYAQYQNAYPVIDTDCIVNHICHHFEEFETEMQKQTIAEGTKMLGGFVSGKPLNADILRQVEEIVVSYHRYKQFAVRAYNTNRSKSNKDKNKESGDAMKMMRVHYLGKILEMVNGDLQTAFDYLVAAVKGNEKIVWEIFDTEICRLIKRGKQ